MSNTLAYYDNAKSIAIKSVIVQTPHLEACTIKLFAAVIVAVS